MERVVDLYGVLGVPESAGPEDIKKAYRSQAKRFHPDANPGDKKSEEKFKEIGQAYEILSDPEKRRRYDSMRKEPLGGRTRAPESRAGFEGPWGQAGSVEDLFSMFFGQGSSTGGFPGRGTFGGMEDEGAGDLDADVWVNFEDAALGNPVTVQLEGRPGPLRLNLPPGAESGLRLRLAAQGSPRRRGRRGDLFLTLKVRPSDRFTRQGLDVTSKVTVNLAQALLGAKVTAPTLRGDVRLSVPACTQPGTRLRLAGQGVEAEGRKGDHFVEVLVQMPTDLDASEKSAMEAMAMRRAWVL